MEMIFKAVFLGVLNGLAEFLPVSSTGHLIIAEHILGISQEKFGLTFDAALHLGTAVAVFWFFSGRWLRIMGGLWEMMKKGKKNKEGELGLYLLLATVPAAVIGLKLEKVIETAFRQPRLVAVALIVGSVLLWLAEKMGRQKIGKIGEIGVIKSFAIGLAQSLALVPGISRSGITIAGGMFLGFSRKTAAEFAFLLSGPIILGAGGKKFLEVTVAFFHGSTNGSEISFFMLGIMSSALSGWLAIKFLLTYLNHHSLKVFIIYRIILAIVILIFLK